MTDKLLMILDLISEHGDRPGDVESFIATALERGPLPVPQVTWTLLGLVHYQTRKNWAWRVLRKRLAPQLRRPNKRKVSIQDVLDGVQKGLVPGLPDWEYSLDSNDSHLVHRGTGENIHIDAINGPELIPEGWFIHHFAQHRAPGPAEARLAQLFPGGGGCGIALRALAKTHLIHPDSEWELTLCGRVTPYAGAVESFLTQWDDPSERLWLAVFIGDWPAAHETALSNGDSAMAVLTAPPAEECRRRWRKRLRKKVSRAGLYNDLVRAIAHAGGDDVPAYLEQALLEPETRRTAVELVADDPAWCKKILKLLISSSRLGGGDDHDDATCARYLGRHGYRVETVIHRLLERENPDWTVLVELALVHSREQLTAFLRKALRSWGEHRLTASAVLALLDTAWSRGVLLEVLDSSDDQDRTFEVRAALRESSGVEAARAARRWEKRHPEKRAARPTDDRFLYSFEGGIKRVLQDRMAELADSVGGVRDRLPQA